jgi:hypothetical protein
VRAESVVVLAKFRVTDLERKERVGYEEEERKRASISGFVSPLFRLPHRVRNEQR